jgi:hypothetical protein
VTAEDWIRAHVEPTGAIETTHERPWATAMRIPLADGIAWFKECRSVQAFEPRLSAELCTRWPDRVGEVLAHDEERGWILFADAGEPMAGRGNPPETTRLRGFAPELAELCDELAAHEVPETVQHDDLHLANVYERHGRFRLLDWGDASISHPFASLVVPYRFLDEINKLQPTDPWFARLRDAYLEPWGSGLAETFALAVRVGAFTYPIAWCRQRDHLTEQERVDFDPWFALVLRRAVAQT